MNEEVDHQNSCSSHLGPELTLASLLIATFPAWAILLVANIVKDVTLLFPIELSASSLRRLSRTPNEAAHIQEYRIFRENFLF